MAKLKEKNFDIGKAKEMVEGKKEEVVPKKTKAKKLGEARDRMSKADVAFQKAAKALQLAEKQEKELVEKLEKAKKDTAEKKDQHQLALNEKNEALCHNLEVEAEPEEEEEDDDDKEMEVEHVFVDGPHAGGIGDKKLAGKGGGPGAGRGRSPIDGRRTRADRSRTPPGGRGGGDDAGPKFSFGITKEQMENMGKGLRDKFELFHKEFESEAKKRKLDEEAAAAAAATAAAAAAADAATAAAKAKKEEDERKAEEIKKQAEKNAAENIRAGVQ